MMNMKTNSTHKILVSIIIPVYNEAEKVEGCLQNIFHVMESLEVPFEIILIDDGSIDGTAEAIKSVRNKGKVRIFSNIHNEGKGSALLKGIDEAKGDVIVTIDGDGQHLPEEIPLLVKPILNGRAQTVIGSRFLEEKNMIPFRHILANKIIRNFFNILYGTHFTDVLLGFRAFRREVFLSNINLKTMGYLIEVEILKELLSSSTKIEEVGVTCLYHQKSSILRGIHITAQILLGIIRFKISSIWKLQRRVY
jgi:glycosyltransferase involved in cell wall biosynthesis